MALWEVLPEHNLRIGGSSVLCATVKIACDCYLPFRAVMRFCVRIGVRR